MTFTLAITGANGFVGPHVARLAQEAGLQVWATARESEPNERLAPYCDNYHSADLEKEWPFPTGVDAVVHLAGLAAVGRSFDEPQRYLAVNSAIMTTMCEALVSRRESTRIVVVSSGSVYAPPIAERPVAENHPIVAASPYAVAKILVETQAAYYARRGLDTVVARPFNHIGPGQGPGFLIPDLAAQLLKSQEGASLRTGNLSSARDYTDVRDVAAAYVLLATAAAHRHHVYNVASGHSRTGSTVLAAIAGAMGRPLPLTSVDAGLLRPGDVPDIRGDAARLREEFGWAPIIGWHESIGDFVRTLG